MTEEAFVGLVRTRARVPTHGEAVAVARAVLTTLAERLEPDATRRVGAQLPREIGFLIAREAFAAGQRFPFHDFCRRVAAREQTDPPLAALHARGVFETLVDALSTEEVVRLRSQLPADYASLFSPNTEDRSRPGPHTHRVTVVNPLPRGL